MKSNGGFSIIEATFTNEQLVEVLIAVGGTLNGISFMTINKSQQAM